MLTDRITIQTLHEDGRVVKVDGKVLEETSNILAVTKAYWLNKRWEEHQRFRVTHVLTGLALPGLFLSFDGAKDAALWLWTYLSDDVRIALAGTNEDTMREVFKMKIRTEWNLRYNNEDD